MNNITISKEQVRSLGAHIPTACGNTLLNDPPEVILLGAIQYIGNLEQTIRAKSEINKEIHNICDQLEVENGQLEDEINHLKKLYDQTLSDYVSLRKELRAYKLLDELSQKYTGGLYDQSEGIEYLRNLLNSTCR